MCVHVCSVCAACVNVCGVYVCAYVYNMCCAHARVCCVCVWCMCLCVCSAWLSVCAFVCDTFVCVVHVCVCGVYACVHTYDIVYLCVCYGTWVSICGVYAHACAYDMHICVCVCVLWWMSKCLWSVCICMKRPEDAISCHSLGAIHFDFLNRVPSLALELVSLGWLVSKPQECACLYLPNPGITNKCILLPYPLTPTGL